MIDNGGGSGGTDWNAKTVDQIWQSLENQDTTNHWTRLTGWRQSYELTIEHLGRVKTYRQSLAEAWPPEKSPAAAAYLKRLDNLIDYLQDTYDAAVANHKAFQGATLALSDHRREVKKIYDEYVLNQGKINEFNARLAKNPTSGGLAAGGRGKPKPPVSDQRQEELNNQARILMFKLSSELTHAQVALKNPSNYKPDVIVEEDGEARSTSTYAPPPFPPPPFAERAASSHQSLASAGTHPASTGNPPTTVGNNPGLVLGGTSPVTTPPTPGPQPLPPHVGPPGTMPNPPVGIPSIPGSGGIPLTKVSSSPFGTNSSARTGPNGFSGGPTRPMQPGGVIGGMPGSGQLGAGARSTQRVNPVGGIIGPNGTSSRSVPGSQGQGKGSMPLGGLGGRSHSAAEGREELGRWDPDNPWETDQGVSPVVLPISEGRVDPGPAIGLNR
jgi:hypothetical protein